jgi:hypothetical protein
MIIQDVMAISEYKQQLAALLIDVANTHVTE